nr:putative pentatricopeptide repeat-containing protein At3g16890, mitochondrial [Tanacetum cinerariifolium]
MGNEENLVETSNQASTIKVCTLVKCSHIDNLGLLDCDNKGIDDVIHKKMDVVMHDIDEDIINTEIDEAVVEREEHVADETKEKGLVGGHESDFHHDDTDIPQTKHEVDMICYVDNHSQTVYLDALLVSQILLLSMRRLSALASRVEQIPTQITPKNPIKPNPSTTTVLANTLYRKGPVLLSKEVVDLVRSSGCSVTEESLCVLISSWGRLGLAKYVAQVFDQISLLGIAPSTRLYNAVIDALVKSNALDLAYLKFQQMKADRCSPDRFTYNFLIHGVCKVGVVDEGLRLVKQMQEMGYAPNVFTYTILIDGYCNAKRTDEAFKVLERMKESVRPNEATFRSLVNGVFRNVGPLEGFKLLSDFVDNEDVLPVAIFESVLHSLSSNSLVNETAIFLKKSIERGYVPDTMTFNMTITCLLKGFDLIEICKIVDGLIGRGMNLGFNSYLVLVEALYKNGKLEEGNRCLTKILDNGLLSNVVSYNMMIDGFCKTGMIDKAMKTFLDMLQCRVSPNLVTFNTLLSWHCKNGDIREVRELLKMLLQHGLKPDTYTFTSIIHGLCRTHQIDDAFDCLNEMVDWGVNPNAITYNILIRSLCIVGDIYRAQALLNSMQVNGVKPDVFSFNALIQNFCRMKEFEKAQKVLVTMLTLGVDSYASWSCFAASLSVPVYSTSSQFAIFMGPLMMLFVALFWFKLGKGDTGIAGTGLGYLPEPGGGSSGGGGGGSGGGSSGSGSVVNGGHASDDKPDEIVVKALQCFNEKEIYSSCEESYRLTESGQLHVPPEYVNEYCHGPCLQETHLVLNCVDDILSHFVFYNHATVQDVKETIKIGCSDGPHKGDFDDEIMDDGDDVIIKLSLELRFFQEGSGSVGPIRRINGYGYGVLKF